VTGLTLKVDGKTPKPVKKVKSGKKIDLIDVSKVDFYYFCIYNIFYVKSCEAYPNKSVYN